MSQMREVLTKLGLPEDLAKMVENKRAEVITVLEQMIPDHPMGIDVSMSLISSSWTQYTRAENFMWEMLYACFGDKVDEALEETQEDEK